MALGSLRRVHAQRGAALWYQRLRPSGSPLLQPALPRPHLPDSHIGTADAGRGRNINRGTADAGRGRMTDEDDADAVVVVFDDSSDDDDDDAAAPPRDDSSDDDAPPPDGAAAGDGDDADAATDDDDDGAPRVEVLEIESASDDDDDGRGGADSVASIGAVLQASVRRDLVGVPTARAVAALGAAAWPRTWAFAARATTVEGEDGAAVAVPRHARVELAKPLAGAAAPAPPAQAFDADGEPIVWDKEDAVEDGDGTWANVARPAAGRCAASDPVRKSKMGRAESGGRKFALERALARAARYQRRSPGPYGG